MHDWCLGARFDARSMLNTEQTDHPMSVVMLWIAVDVPTSRVDGILRNTESKQAAELGCVQLLLPLLKGLESLSSM
jgi:hypothetical protein